MFKGYMATNKNIWTNFRYATTQAFTSTSWNETEKKEYAETGSDSAIDVYGIHWVGQTIHVGGVGPDEHYYITNVSFYGKKYGSPGMIYVYFYTANVTGLPTGSPLSSGSLDLGTISTAYQWINISMIPYNVNTNTEYAIMIKSPSTYPNYFKLNRMLAIPPYTGGKETRSDDDGTSFYNDSADIYFRVWGATPVTSATYGTTSKEITTASGSIDIIQSSLSSGQLYYYKSWGNDSNGNMTLGNMRYTLTNPGVPVFLNLIPYFTNNSVKITWVKGVGANQTVVVKNNLAYPSVVTDGLTEYNDTGSLCWVHNISFNTTYYFSLFGFTVWDGLSRFSSGVHVPWGGITFIVYNESKPWQVINASMIVTDSLGLYPVQFSNIYGYYSFNISQIPYGENTLFYVSNSSYHSRLYPITIIPNIFYNFSFYLPPLWKPPGGPPGGNETGSYRIQIINDYQVPVQGALVKIYKYFNTTSTYTYIGGFVSDGNGQGSINLYPFQLYMIKITCDGYTNTTEFWTPTVEEQSLAISKTFKIYTSIAPEPTIFDNLIVAIEPAAGTFDDSFTAFFNVSSSNAKLMWFTATMSRYNSTTASWLCLYSNNITTTIGGGIGFTVPNITGVYRWSCSFGKQKFSNYTMVIDYSILWAAGANNSLDVLVKKIVGRSPIYVPSLSGETVASWSALIAAFVSIFVLFGFSPKFSGLAIMATGGILGFCKSPLGLIPNDVLNWVACGFIVILGVLLIMADKKEGGEQ
jgi:hypothetical protein